MICYSCGEDGEAYLDGGNGDGPFCPRCAPELICPDCLSATGGICRAHQEPECTCYEITGGHQPGCAFNRTVPA